ncbi:hypothetical protein Y887_17820 [Xanthomonas pisi DSM 18956]|uniref:Uncharacterized protein n=2 Tax=Xanthomonas pisi TaxID=56457 RepID=A0A2S7D5T9_9XANT|nr:hypothetical protein Y887_17820 [Xanthomonas pisi DSM 18956]PPU69186.1 hypothetical protein XpiCFBP4643_06565 [Xanthomonas pisi]
MSTPERAWVIVLAKRSSPDWKALARDYAAGMPVPPTRYFPFHDPRFPREVPDLIDRWNRLSNVSYFECRARLCEIADQAARRVDGATVITWTEVATYLARRSDGRVLVFYHDDDDWFHPSLAGMLDELDVTSVDAVVFSFIRLASVLTTFTFQGVRTAAAIGRCEAFRYRYCTNNYGLTARALSRAADLVEHTDASAAAEAFGFVDLQIDAVLSATNKTPCSATWLSRLPDTKCGFDRYIRAYIQTLEGMEIPAQSNWIERPLHQTIDLFRSTAQ